MLLAELAEQEALEHLVLTGAEGGMEVEEAVAGASRYSTSLTNSIIARL